MLNMLFQHLEGQSTSTNVPTLRGLWCRIASGSRPDRVRMASGWRPDGVRMESGWSPDGVGMASRWWDGVQMRQDRPDCISQRPYCGLDAVQVVRKAFGRYPDASGRIRTHPDIVWTASRAHRARSARRKFADNISTNVPTVRGVMFNNQHSTVRGDQIN